MIVAYKRAWYAWTLVSLSYSPMLVVHKQIGNRLKLVLLILFVLMLCVFFFFSSRRRHTRCLSDWSSDVCSSDLPLEEQLKLSPLVTNAMVYGDNKPFNVALVVANVEAVKELAREKGLGGDVRSEERRVGKEWR